eukprot:570669-Pelagomonas_calceolata.AAC.4
MSVNSEGGCTRRESEQRGYERKQQGPAPSVCDEVREPTRRGHEFDAHAKSLSRVGVRAVPGRGEQHTFSSVRDKGGGAHSTNRGRGAHCTKKGAAQGTSTGGGAYGSPFQEQSGLRAAAAAAPATDACSVEHVPVSISR